MGAKTKIARYEFLCKWLIEVVEGRKSPIPKHAIRGIMELMKVEVEGKRL